MSVFFFFKIKIEEALSLSLCLSLYLSHSVQKDFHVTIEGPTKVFGHGSRAHNLGNLNDIVEGDIPVVLDILCLLLVTLRLLQCLDDQSHYQWHHRHLGLTILHGQASPSRTSPSSPSWSPSLCLLRSSSTRDLADQSFEQVNSQHWPHLW